MIHQIKPILSRNITNVWGWRTSRKIVVIESDDWGSIRMPNKDVYDAYKNLGYNIDSSPYCKYDTLANTEDLNALFEILRMFKGRDGRHPKFTFNTVMANPIFKEIRKSDYSEYFYEPFPETLNRYYPNENVFKLWKQGIDEKLIQPQFHGREHVHVHSWLAHLSRGNKPLLDAFQMGFWGIPKTFYEKSNISIQAAFGSYDLQQLEFYRENIREGLQLFEDIFGFKSKTFIPSNYTYPEELNSGLHDCGVIGIQGMRKQKIPQENASLITKVIYTGKRNEYQQRYTVRNAMLEPSQMPKRMDNVGECLKDIGNSFLWHKPAIINSHRVNYVGSIDKENRIRSLSMLKNLLYQIIKKWPEVEFLSSDELVDVMNEEH
ncbi:hypothetical protein EI546_05945 [Aequorivita sp. H23M31]|uniref:Polysaccharide deacetylase n=1 Tax=Aequorivita ciconiae TaxID=2494375 RepID=A0A410G1Y9_9FLAO|nr:hypothetical protein [Aequorivita sp. H23M31]QAA81297.1 hypothetical protein EI546_05945 [Aequorivita sp. H23M31]